MSAQRCTCSWFIDHRLTNEPACPVHNPVGAAAAAATAAAVQSTQTERIRRIVLDAVRAALRGQNVQCTTEQTETIANTLATELVCSIDLVREGMTLEEVLAVHEGREAA